MSDALRMSWWDVFCDRPFAGNPLAVFPDADRLEPVQMQAIAREIGLSESVFITGGAEALRIFTPTAELPLAGHPVVGAALELARLGRIRAEGESSIRSEAGLVELELADGIATMLQLEPRLGRAVDQGSVAAALGEEIVAGPRFCSTTGLAQLFVQVSDRNRLRRLQPDVSAIAALEGVDGVCAWCEDENGVAQRFFAPRMGIVEDPATGSAAGALAALRVFNGADPGPLKVTQGEELGRPSILHVSVEGSPGTPATIRVGGRGVLILEGSLSAQAIA